MIIKKGDYVETKIGEVRGEVLKIDRDNQRLYIKLSPTSPFTDFMERTYVAMNLVTKVYPKVMYVVDYVINAEQENEDVIYDEFDNLKSARKRYKEVVANPNNKYARICKRLSSTYEIIDTIEEDC